MSRDIRLKVGCIVFAGKRVGVVAIGQGKSNAEIAGELYMSIATVKAYVTRIFYKLGVDNRVQVAMRVHDAGLV